MNTQVSTLTVPLLLDLFGILIGITSIATILRGMQGMGGRVGSTLRLFIWGIVFQVGALLYTVVFARLKLLPLPGGVDIHHLLMTIGLIVFVLAGRQFAALSNKSKN